MLSVVLQDCIRSGWCRLLSDNLYVLGYSYKETVARWQIVLQLLADNNLKLSPNKAACFPPKLDLLGWTKEGKMLVPDPHRQNRLAKCPLPNTVEQLRSYLGGYRTFYRCKADMSMILRELELFAARIPRPKSKILTVFTYRNQTTNLSLHLTGARKALVPPSGPC